MVDQMTGSASFIEGRGKKFCRGCLGTQLFSALDLGDLPIANELLHSNDVRIEKYPLHLKICPECGLGQVADVVTPERIFMDYRYLSSMSTTFLQHAADFVQEFVNKSEFESDDWVLEIASNDGYLLKNLIPLGITAVGVEPAENVAEISRSLGIHTISEFFSSKLASRLVSERGYPKLIIANNVMAHVPDLIDFVQGLGILCGPMTRISIENPSLTNILIDMQFDTIYHEHYSYLSATSVSNICRKERLLLFKVEKISVHGGSNRYWLRRESEKELIDESVTIACNFESQSGLFSFLEWEKFSFQVSTILDNFRAWLQDGKLRGKKIYGYGAAAKASTLLNSMQSDGKIVIAIADLSPEKQGRFMPVEGIPIISPSMLLKESPTDIVIFPWNIKKEIAQYLRSNLDDEVKLWCVIPQLGEV